MGIGMSCCFGQSKDHMNPKVEEQMKKLKRDKECSTLEEWLISSPATLNKNMSSKNGGDFVVLSRQSSKKIHPSRLGAHNAESSSDPRNSLSKERLLDDDGDSSSICAEGSRGLCQSSSGRGKKKVSFRLPGETDIFVFHSLEIEPEE